MPSPTVSALARFETKKHIRMKISKCAAVPLFKDGMIMLGNMPRLKARRKQPAASQFQIINDCADEKDGAYYTKELQSSFLLLY